MNNISHFFEQNIVVVYFLYGLAFFCMGLAVWLESGRTSELRLARAMGPLAAFGVLHGLHEWTEMFLLLGTTVPNAPAIAQSVTFNAARLALLVFSFLMLIVFGVRLIHISGRGRGNERTFILLTAGTLIIVWLVSVVATQRVYRLCLADCLVSIDVLTRYILAIPGALLAAWAMLLEQRAFRQRGMATFGRDLQWAAVALILYGVVGQAFPPASVLFPANIINSAFFFDVFGFPVQFYRAIMAGIMALFIIRALRAFDLENRQHLSAAREAKLAAQREALAAQRRAREDTEKLNRELQVAVQDLSVLYNLSNRLAATLDLDTLLESALQTILNSIPRMQAGMILLRPRHNGSLEVMAQSGCEVPTGSAGDELPLVCEQLRCLGDQVAESGVPAMQCDDRQIYALDDPTGRLTAGHDDRPDLEGRIVGMPLFLNDTVRGSLVLGVQSGARPLTRRDLSLLGTVAGQMGMAIEKATLYEEVQEREALRAELYRRIVSAQERERQRIARELHDGTGQVLTGLGLGLKAAAEAATENPELASRQLTELKDLSARALQELRELIADLRPSVLDDMGLVPALKSQVQEFSQRAGVEASLMVDGQRRRLQPEIETVLFRITQEALTNVAKHAGAEHAMVRLIFDEESVQLIVTDDGHGFDPKKALRAEGAQRRAWGLLGMQERVALVGGACEIVSKSGVGSTVRVAVPTTVETVEKETSE